MAINTSSINNVYLSTDAGTSYINKIIMNTYRYMFNIQPHCRMWHDHSKQQPKRMICDGSQGLCNSNNKSKICLTL